MICSHMDSLKWYKADLKYMEMRNEAGTDKIEVTPKS